METQFPQGPQREKTVQNDEDADGGGHRAGGVVQEKATVETLFSVIEQGCIADTVEVGDHLCAWGKGFLFGQRERMMFGGGGPEVPIARLVDECGGDAGRFFLNLTLFCSVRSSMGGLGGPRSCV